MGPRNADGSLPNVDFLRLKKGSRAIDQGEDLGFPFAGEAPDLGAFEYGMPSSSSVAESSSSAGGTTFVAARLGNFAEKSGVATVFDLQGRYLGVLQAEQLRGESLADALQTKLKTPGAYLVRMGQSLQKVNVK